MTHRGSPSANSDGQKDSEKAMSIINERDTKTADREPDTPPQAGSMIILQEGEPPPSSTPQRKTHAIAIMFAICISVALVSMDTVILTTALPTIAVALEVSDSGFAWTGATHMIGNAVFIPFWGKFGDVVGRKRALLLAHTVFMVGSLVSALCRDLPMLLVGRALQGAGGGGLVILANSIIGDRFGEWERTVYARFVAVTWSMAYAVGPIVGGAFAQSGLWRWCFWGSYFDSRVRFLLGELEVLIFFFNCSQNRVRRRCSPYYSPVPRRGPSSQKPFPRRPQINRLPRHPDHPLQRPRLPPRPRIRRRQFPLDLRHGALPHRLRRPRIPPLPLHRTESRDRAPVAPLPLHRPQNRRFANRLLRARHRVHLLRLFPALLLPVHTASVAGALGDLVPGRDGTAGGD